MAATNGNDTINWVPGDQLINGLSGQDTLSFASLNKGVNANLLAGSATVINTTTGYLTSQPAMLTGENGFKAFAIATNGISLNTGSDFNSLNGPTHNFVSNFDGIGATSLNSTTIRLFVNHEVASSLTPSYLVYSGLGDTISLTGARIDYIDIDKTTFAIKDTGLAYNVIYDTSGHAIVSAAAIGGGLSKFCSSSLYEANEFGSGRGVEDQLYFTGQESGGLAYVLDTSAGGLWAVGAFGHGAYENTTQIDTGNNSNVAFLLSSDKAGSPMFLYIGTKDNGGDFLDRNGLRDGQLFFWKANNGDQLPGQFASGQRAGSWVAIEVRDAQKAGQAGFDSKGFKLTETLSAEALAQGAFSFSRPEDCATNPLNGQEIVFAATGGSASDLAGAVYTMNFDFTDLGAPKATTKILYDGDLDANRALRNPDNLDWSSDGYIYIQEDRVVASLFGAGSANPNEASIVRIDPLTGVVTRVAHMNRGAVPSGFEDMSASTVGTWESTGLLDISALLGKAGGSVFLSNVMTHGLSPGVSLSSTSLRDSQLLVLTASGETAHPAIDVDRLVSIENLTGSNFADTLVGNNGVNILRGNGGADKIFGNGGDDWLSGGLGADVLAGGAGRDSAYYAYAAAAVSLALDTSIAARGEAIGDRFYLIEDIHGSDYSDTLVGNGSRNIIRGLGGADIINGKAGDDTIRGGTGVDRLTGGTGSDNFRYISKSELGDVVVDFSSSAASNDDRFTFLNSAFGNLGVGKLATSEFQSSTSATALTGSVRFFFETDTGVLRYDDDGNGGHQSIVVATLQVGAKVTWSDIDIVAV